MAGILPLSGTQQFDNATAAFLNGGQLYLFFPAIHAADGLVRGRIKNAAGVQQLDEDNIAIVTAASGGSAPTPIPDATQIFGTRDIKIRFDDQPLPGYVRLNGRTVGSGSSGATERANPDVQELYLEFWPYANIGVVGGKAASAAADWAANKQLTLPGRITSATVANPTLPGSGAALNTISPVMLFMIYVKI